jgi:SAM-dependent methyltransferase
MGDAESYVGQDLEALAEIPNYQRWILRHFRPHLAGRVLEVGAGIGTFSEQYVDQVEQAVLLEPAQNLIGRLSERFSGMSKVRVVPRVLEEARGSGDGLEPKSFDAVVLINVLEHVDDDRAMLAQLFELLKPGGHLLVFVPALSWLFGSLDELVGHRRRYHRQSLSSVVEAAGFLKVDLRYFDVLGVVPWWLAGRVLRQREFNAAAARLYDTVAVPLGRAVEALHAPPIGKNLLCTAQRP